MKRNPLLLLITLILMGFLTEVHSQGVAINETNAPPDPSAMLDVESTTKGLLFPRLTSAQRASIAAPASGLVVYDTDFNALFVMTGEGWIRVDYGDKWLKDEDNNLTYNQANVGIGVPYPSALLHTSGSGSSGGNVLFEGVFKTSGVGNPPAQGPGTRMMWFPDKAAFRAGNVTSTQWDNSNLGIYSTATGFNTKASGSFSSAWGSVTTASGSQSTAFGFNTNASGNSATAFGENTTAPSFVETVLGYNNTSYTPASATTWNSLDRLFVIGNGFSGSSDALVLLKNGNLGLGTSTPSQRLDVAGSIYSQSTTNWAIRGVKSGPGSLPGVWGETESTSSGATGVRGYALSTTTPGGSAGVHGRNFALNNFGYGVRGTHDSGGWGVYGETVSGRGVNGVSTSTTIEAYGVYGQSASATGVHGVSTATDGLGRGVYGLGTTTGIRGDAPFFGLYGEATAASGAKAVFADAPGGNNYGVYSQGNVYVSENLTVSGNKSFIIDHPLDPSEKYLYHFNTESPEPYNMYRGTVILDENGSASVSLPDYFESINIDFTYHLTPVGKWAPVYIADEIKGNQFLISGGEHGLKVSWQVTAVRNDPWVRDKGYQAEVEKPQSEKGTYIYPEGYGKPAEMGRDYSPDKKNESLKYKARDK
ncbi:MAG: hypothetical protein JNL22_02720 [Bacteroidales bacterium]|nr:hypothetical protein [Bacteroidales bacterium]